MRKVLAPDRQTHTFCLWHKRFYAQPRGVGGSLSYTPLCFDRLHWAEDHVTVISHLREISQSVASLTPQSTNWRPNDWDQQKSGLSFILILWTWLNFVRQLKSVLGSAVRRAHYLSFRQFWARDRWALATIPVTRVSNGFGGWADLINQAPVHCCCLPWLWN